MREAGDGKIVQRGLHDELYAEKGIYRDFFEIREESLGWKIGRSVKDSV
jgi:hypothetical protein